MINTQAFTGDGETRDDEETDRQTAKRTDRKTDR